MKNIPFDDIGFGNPSSRDFLIMKQDSYLDKLLPELQRFSPPKNSSAAAVSELKQLVNYVNSKREVKNNLYDEGLMKMIKELFMQGGADEQFIDQVSGKIAEDVIPILTKLKFFFNRPRPAQLSYYYDLEFFPDFSYFTNSPSYPSSHVALTVITTHVLGNIYPEMYNKAIPIIEEVKKSRLLLGVHYPSDNDMSMVVAKAVLENPEFKATFKL